MFEVSGPAFTSRPLSTTSVPSTRMDFTVQPLGGLMTRTTRRPTSPLSSNVQAALDRGA